MISDRELWTCANTMLKQHGDDAGIRAAQRADALLDVNDHAGVAVWTKIVRCIEILGRNLAPEGTVH